VPDDHQIRVYAVRMESRIVAERDYSGGHQDYINRSKKKSAEE
jgi:hypothetical protein